MGFWQPAQWACWLKSRKAIAKEKPSAPLFPLHGFVPGPSQLLCLPKGLDTVAQLHLQAPDTSLEHSQSSGRRQPRKPITIDTFHTSSLLGLYKRSRRPQPKKTISFLCNCQSQKVAADVAQGCSCNTDRHPCKHYFRFLIGFSQQLNANTLWTMCFLISF